MGGEVEGGEDLDCEGEGLGRVAYAEERIEDTRDKANIRRKRDQHTEEGEEDHQ